MQIDPASPTGSGRPSLFASIALLLGMLAMLGAVAHLWLGPIEAPVSLEDSIAASAVSIRDRVVARLSGEAPAEPVRPSRWNADRIAGASIALAAVSSLLLAVAGFVRREDARVVGSAAALGGTALAVQFALVALGLIAFAIVRAAVVSKLDFGVGQAT